MQRHIIFTVSLALAACTLFACTGGGNKAQLAQAPDTKLTMPGLEELAAPNGVDLDLWQQIKEVFEVEYAKAEANRATAGAPRGEGNRIPDFRITITPDDQVKFEWSYRNLGDYDQNGEVNISDLTQIVLGFGADTTDPNWQAKQVVDGDSNGEINLSDITPIAMNFGSTVVRYLLEASGEAQGSDWLVVAVVPFSAGVIPSQGGFREYTYFLDIEEVESGSFFRTAPHSDPGGEPEIGSISPITDPNVIPSPEVEVEYSLVPQDVTATQGTETGKVLISWSAVIGAQYYQIYRASVIDGAYIELGQSVPGEQTYNDETVLEGVHFWYTVAGELGIGAGEQSEAAEGWSNKTPDVPTNVQASDGTSSTGIVVTWDKATGANGYKVYRDSEDFQVATLGDVDSWEDTTLLDTDEHSYWVSAVSYDLESELGGPGIGFRGTAPEITGVTPVKLYHGTEFTLSATVTGDMPITYAWDFGGGATPNTPNDETPTVTIASTGEYFGSLTCSNAAGQDVYSFGIGEPLFTELLIVYNSDMPDDLDLVEYYSSIETGRAIHPDYRLGLPLGESAAQTISRELYGSDIRDPIIDFIDDPVNAEVKANIKYLLMMKGVPYKIPGTNGGNHDLSTNACVDSELCMLRAGDAYRLEGPVWSGAYYQDFEEKTGFWEANDVDFEPDTFPLMDLNGDTWTLNYLVCRITAYTYEDCKLMIDRSLAADTSGTGWTILDTKPGSNVYETMHDPVWPEEFDLGDSGFTLLTAAGLNVFGDVTADVVTRDYVELPGGAADNILAYCSWGKHSAFDQFYILDDLNFLYRPGACFMSYESFNGTTMRNTNPDDPSEGHPGQGQIADFIYMGGTVAIGNVYEPWTDGVGDERWVFDRYVHHGDRWIEAAYKGLYYVSWQEVVIGDPLCRVVAE